MKEQLEKIKGEALRQIEPSKALEKLNGIRISYLGKKGELMNLLKSMKDVVPEDRSKVGRMINDVRRLVEGRLEEVRTVLAKRAREEQLKREVIDVTLPARKNNVDHSHPNTVALEEVERIFVGMGYKAVEGPEVEYDRCNSERLNILKGHSARDEQDTFYTNENALLRSQTLPVQMRTIEQGKLLIRMIVPGRVFRPDEVDVTHPSSLHQIEGLMTDKNITFADLEGTLAEFVRESFRPETKVKFRPHHFPFTEPNAEVDMTCLKCGGSGCRFYKRSGQVEILGCGVVHSHVLEMYGIDPDAYSGSAFSAGLERIALLKHEIDDMRLLYEGDTRLLKQF